VNKSNIYLNENEVSIYQTGYNSESESGYVTGNVTITSNEVTEKDCNGSKAQVFN
jgi:hypothetical protein